MPEYPLQSLDFDLHIEPKVLVERGKGLVEQQDRWLDRQCARQCHALLLATGELARQTFGHRGKPDEFEQALRFAPTCRRVDAAGSEAIGDVFGDRQMRKQGVILEDDADGAPVGWQPDRRSRRR